jgi:hypothetical protein
VLKLLTAKTARDFGYLKAIAGLELIAAAVLSEASFLGYLAVFVLFDRNVYERRSAARGGRKVVVSRGGLRNVYAAVELVSACLFGGICS